MTNHVRIRAQNSARIVGVDRSSDVSMAIRAQSHPRVARVDPFPVTIRARILATFTFAGSALAFIRRYAAVSSSFSLTGTMAGFVRRYAAAAATFTCTVSAAASVGAEESLALLLGETEGLAIDFTGNSGLGSVSVRDAGTPANKKVNVQVDSFLIQSGTSPHQLRNVAAALAWSAHNLFVNSTSAPATQNVTLVTGATYTFGVTGSGSLAGSSGASGTATAGNPVTFVATGTTGTFTVTGSLTTMQINRGSSLTAYMATAAAAKFAVPIEYDAATSKYYGLVEPAATNLLRRSREFESTAWGNQGMVVAANSTAAPDGATTADTLATAVSNGPHNLFQQATLALSTVFTVSAFGKKGTHNYAVINAETTAENHIAAVFNLNSGTFGESDVGTSSGTIVSTSIAAMANGWDRLTLTGSVAVADPYMTVGLAAAATGNVFNTFGEPIWNAAGTESIVAWQAQLETGPVATSPVPTYSSTITRAADAVNAALSTVPFSATAGTVYLKGKTPKAAAASVLLSFDDGTANERLRITYTGTNINVVVTDGGVVQATLDLGAVAVDTAYQVTFGWQLNSFAASLNGGAIVTDVSGTLPTVTTLRFGYSPAGEQGVTKYDKLAYVPRRVTDVALPTWRYAA